MITKPQRVTRGLAVAAWFRLWAGLQPHAASKPLVAFNVNRISAGTANSFAATTLDAHLAKAGVAIGPGVLPSGALNTFGCVGGSMTSLAAAIAHGDYLSITIAPRAGHIYSLTSLTATFSSTSAEGVTIALLSSAMGFTDGRWHWIYRFAGNLAPPTQSLDLSDVAALSDLTTAIELRFYAYSGTGYPVGLRIRHASGNDLALYGTTSAIPEPSFT